MQEAFIILSIVAALALAPFAFAAGPDVWMLLGVWTIALGLGFGIPTGVWYHVALYRSLVLVDALPERWWLRPTELHDRIPASRRRRVLGWCYAGAAGFVLTILGCLITGIGAIRAL